MIFFVSISLGVSVKPAVAAQDEAAMEAIRAAAKYTDLMKNERTREALESALERTFSKADVDANGRLDVADRVLREQILIANRRSAYLGGFGEFDLDGDRVLTDAEVMAYATYEVRAKRGSGAADFPAARDAMISKIHAKLEVDAVGVLTLQEYSELISTRFPSTAAALKARLRPLPPDAAAFDADGDGVVSPEEFFGPVGAQLDRLDANANALYEDAELD